jgi:CRP-like cAMP-binding protein
MKANPDQKISYLQMVDIFQDLSQDEMAEMDRTTTMSTCKKGKIFYQPEDTTEVLFILKKGRVQLYRISPDGKKLIVATVGAGTIFGEMSIIGQGLQNTFAEAAEDCLLCVMSRHDVERLVLSKPAVSLRIMQVIANRLTIAESQLEDFAFKSIPTRLAAHLLRLRQEQGDRIYGYTHQDLAEAVGTYRETATQTLNEFKADQLIAIGRKRIEILDPEGLALIAEEQ